MAMAHTAPPRVALEQWEIVPVTYRGRPRYELHQGYKVRIDMDSHARIQYRSITRAMRVRDRLRRRDELRRR